MAAAEIMVMEEQTPYLTMKSDEPEPSTIQPYTQVRNDLLDIAMPHLSSAAFCVVMRIERHTSGYHRESAVISISSQLTRETGLSKPTVLKAIDELERRGIVQVDTPGAGRARASTFRILPCDAWQLSSDIGKESLPIESGKGIGKELSPIPTDIGKDSLPIGGDIGEKSLPHIKKEKKEKREKENPLSSLADGEAPTTTSVKSSPSPKASKTFPLDSRPYKSAEYLASKILQHKPDAKVPRSAADLQRWAAVMDLLFRVDKRDAAVTARVIDWATADPFWQAIIFSASKFREKFDQLESAMGNAKERAAPQRNSATPLQRPQPVTQLGPAPLVRAKRSPGEMPAAP
jgi:hypothetical protein